MPARRHGGDTDADAAGALNVVGRVPDDPDAVGLHRTVKTPLNFTPSFTGHIIAAVVMIAKAAEGEMMTQLIVTELQASARTDIAGEQTNGYLITCRQLFQKSRDTG